MDPVNPAPAGNPQLTTHLLVSHKKNKNFHPSKVSLKRVHFVNKQLPFRSTIVPDEEFLILNHVRRFGIRGNKMKTTDCLLKEYTNKDWISQGIKHRPYTMHLKLQFDEITNVGNGFRTLNVFKNIVFTLRIFDWDDKQLVLISEKDVCHEQMSSTLDCWITKNFGDQIPSVN